MAQALSDREKQVLDLAAQGHIDERIGQELNISVATVRGYWLRIRSKLGGSSRAELVGRWVSQRAEEDRVNSADRHIREMAQAEIATDSAIAAEREEMDKLLSGLPEAQLKRIADLRTRTDESRRIARLTEAEERKARSEESFN